MQRNSATEIVASLGGGVSQVTGVRDAAACLAGPVCASEELDCSFRAAARHSSSSESKVTQYVKRLDIPAIGRDVSVELSNSIAAF